MSSEDGSGEPFSLEEGERVGSHEVVGDVRDVWTPSVVTGIQDVNLEGEREGAQCHDDIIII